MRSLSRTLRISLTAILTTVPFAIQANAQHGPDLSTRTTVPGIDVLPLPGMPFSAIDIIVWTRSLGDSGNLTTYVKAKVFRDGQGRIYRERHHFVSDQNADPQTSLSEFTVDDPIARTRIACIVPTHSCQITVYRPPHEQPLPPQGQFDQGKRTLTREPLGSQTFDDLPVVGTRETVVILSGTVGNDTPITLSREFWYSEDLHTNLSVTRKSPTEGTQAITFTKLSRNEPDPSAFAIPANYTVTDARQLTRPPAN